MWTAAVFLVGNHLAALPRPSAPISENLAPECAAAQSQLQWPQFHVLNRVTPGNPPKVDHLNDANAIFEWKGMYHVMNQGAPPPTHVNSTPMVNWTHAVSSDLVHWYRVQDAVSNDPSKPWVRFGACDGTASFPGPGVRGADGGPLILFGPDCADPTGFPHEQLGDYPRAAVAVPADPSSPHLLDWVVGPSNVSFDGEPCSFPGKVWRSTRGNYWNMLCSPHWTGNWGSSWSRYTSTDPTLQNWSLADPQFIVVPQGSTVHLDAAAGALFNPIPNAVPGGPTHMLNGVTGQAFWLGTYNASTEKFVIHNDTLHWIDLSGGGGGFSAGAAHWAATSNSFATRPKGSDNRLFWVAWLSGNAQVPNSLTLVRTLNYDAAAGQLVSYPVEEYTRLHTVSYLVNHSMGSLLPGSVNTLPLPPTAGAALDLEVAFDMSNLPPTATAAKFGVAVRAPRDGIAGAANFAEFSVSATQTNGRRMVAVDGVMNRMPGKGPTPPYPCHRNVCPPNITTLLPTERLTVRVLIDKPTVEIFVLGGRIAWVMNDGHFDPNQTSVHLYNSGSHAVSVPLVSAFGMGCGWANALPSADTRLAPAAVEQKARNTEKN
eukprot:m.165748 g.165748  ORF g.165748 m.165748 type:complete len:600 (-) comp14685_c0_seq3:70-1869(-)